MKNKIINKIENAISEMFKLNLAPSSICLSEKEYNLFVEYCNDLIGISNKEKPIRCNYKNIDVYYIKNDTRLPFGSISTISKYNSKTKKIEYGRHFHLEPFKEIL